MKPNRKKWIDSKKREYDKAWYTLFGDIKIKLNEKDGKYTTDIEFMAPDNRMVCRVCA